ncbi:MAG TPA: ABC transporter ATP-binding protein [Polyangiaceae bacterium]|nr:ABC transporter ATP-binding protein [Polyangiaceae bacterium]
MRLVIEVEHLTKDYGTVVAVQDVSFQVGKGEIVGVLGPNGAGKSTTLRILAGFLGATAGSVRVAGFDIVEDSLAAREQIGYMPEAAPLYPEMRVGEYLRFRAALKHVPRGKRRAAVERAMEQARVTEMVDTLIAHLSKGYKQRVGLADALVSNPPLLILDEPTAGLDPNQIREVRKLVRELGESHTILLSTHILSEVEATCERAIVIDRGKLVAAGKLEELHTERRASAANLLLRDPDERAPAILEASPGVKRVRRMPDPTAQDATRFHITFHKKETDVNRLFEGAVAALVGAGIGVREAQLARATLEEVFAQLTRAELEERAGGEDDS